MTADVALTRDLQAVRRARALVQQQLAEMGLDDLADDVALVVSELVSNAVLHGGEPIRFSLTAVTTGVRLAVTDSSANQPIRPLAGTEGMTGRGLQVVEALAVDWGCERLEAGKTVWAVLSRERKSPAEDATPEELIARWADEDAAPVEPAGRYEVELGTVPTDLLIAAKTHGDNLIREAALAAAAGGGELPRPLARLFETVTNRFAAPRQEIKRQAIAAANRGEPYTQLSLWLPLEAADAAEDYLDGLNQVDEYCRAARLLTLESPPAHRVFREWYLGEIIDRLRALAAGRAPRPPRSFDDRLLQEVERATVAERAAERAARVYRVTAALARANTEEDVARAVLHEVLPALAADGAVIVTPDGDRLSVTAAVGYGHELVSALAVEPIESDLPAAWVLRHWEPLWLETREQLRRRFPQLRDFEPATVSMCVVPLEVGVRSIGALRISFGETRLFDPETQAFVYALAAQAALALERTRLAARERREQERLALLAEVSAELSESLDAQLLLRRVVSLSVPMLADVAAAHLVQDERVRTVALTPPDADPAAASGADGVAEVLAGGRAKFHPRRIVVPLSARGRTFGALTFALAGEERRFDPDAMALAEDLARRSALAVDNALLYGRVRDVAESLGRSLLPPRLPIIPGVRLVGAYRPANEDVGGDFYDAWHLDDGAWAFAIGDVRGTGPEAASLTAVVRATLRTLTLSQRDPGAVLEGLNRVLGDGDPFEERFCTVLFGTLTAGAGGLQVQLATGGHPPALLRTAIGTAPVKLYGSLMGAFPEVTVGSMNLLLRPGELLLLYTDGLIESRDGTGERWGDAGLLEAVRRGPTDPEELVDALCRAVPGGDDDIAVLAVSAEPVGPGPSGS